MKILGCRVTIYFDFHDWWIGVYAPNKGKFYAILIPTLVLKFEKEENI